MIWNHCGFWYSPEAHRCPKGFYSRDVDPKLGALDKSIAQENGWQSIGDSRPVWYCPDHRQPVTALPFRAESMKHDAKGRAAAKYFSSRLSESDESDLLEIAKYGEPGIVTTPRPWHIMLAQRVRNFFRIR